MGQLQGILLDNGICHRNRLSRVFGFRVQGRKRLLKRACSFELICMYLVDNNEKGMKVSFAKYMQAGWWEEDMAKNHRCLRHNSRRRNRRNIKRLAERKFEKDHAGDDAWREYIPS